MALKPQTTNKQTDIETGHVAVPPLSPVRSKGIASSYFRRRHYSTYSSPENETIVAATPLRTKAQANVRKASPGLSPVPASNKKTDKGIVYGKEGDALDTLFCKAESFLCREDTRRVGQDGEMKFERNHSLIDDDSNTRAAAAAAYSHSNPENEEHKDIEFAKQKSNALDYIFQNVESYTSCRKEEVEESKERVALDYAFQKVESSAVAPREDTHPLGNGNDDGIEVEPIGRISHLMEEEEEENKTGGMMDFLWDRNDQDLLNYLYKGSHTLRRDEEKSGLAEQKQASTPPRIITGTHSTDASAATVSLKRDTTSSSLLVKEKSRTTEQNKVPTATVASVTAEAHNLKRNTSLLDMVDEEAIEAALSESNIERARRKKREIEQQICSQGSDGNILVPTRKLPQGSDGGNNIQVPRQFKKPAGPPPPTLKTQKNVTFANVTKVTVVDIGGRSRNRKYAIAVAVIFLIIVAVILVGVSFFWPTDELGDA
jgi:hypothetical protein